MGRVPPDIEAQLISQFFLIPNRKFIPSNNFMLLPVPVERFYEAELLRYQRNIEEQFRNLIVSSIPGLRAEFIPLTKTDQFSDDLEREFEILDEQVESTKPFIPASLALIVAARTNLFNKKQWGKVTLANLKFIPFQADAWLDPVIRGFVRENVLLIESLKAVELQQLETMLLREIANGSTNKIIADQIQSTFQKNRARAELIARDQVSKLNGRMTQFRQQGIGIDSYIWDTVDDSRVRPNHASKEGKEFLWSKPPFDTGHPGEDFQCRCRANGKFQDVFDKIGVEVSA